MYQCPNCGGHVVFDPKLQKIKCEYCDSIFDPTPEDLAEINQQNQPTVSVKEADDHYEANVFTCPQCGGEIISDENTAVTFCSYCGGSTVLQGRLSKIKAPDYVIPFQLDKEQAREAYERVLRHSLFAPTRLKKDTVVERFRGIYMPYWIYDFKTEGQQTLRGQKDHRRGDYIYHDHYDVDATVNAEYKGISFDASASFADSLSSGIAPYNYDGKQPFSKDYLAGYYADVSDIPKSVYKSEAREIVKGDIARQIVGKSEFAQYGVKLSSAKQAASPDQEESHLGYFPVWFLSNRTGDRISYAVVNGQTGRVAMDVPISYGKYLLGSLIVALPVFLGMNLFFTITPTVTVIVTMLLGLVAAIVNGIQKHHIFVQENFLDDAGMQALEAKKERAAKRGAAKNGAETESDEDELFVDTSEVKTSDHSENLNTLLMVVGFIFMTGILGPIGVVISIVLWIALRRRGEKPSTVVKTKVKTKPKVPAGASFGTVMIALLKPILGIVVGLMVLIWHPVSDLYYYSAALVAMALVLWSFYDMVIYHNRLATRPLPQFNKRGGDE